MTDLAFTAYSLFVVLWAAYRGVGVDDFGGTRRETLIP